MREQTFRADEGFAHELDRADPLAGFRDRFEIPGNDASGIYFLGNSLGPLPRATRAALARELDGWSRRGVDSYFERPASWVGLDVRYREAMASIVGARPHEVALMNGLSVNLHLLMASFYRPEGKRVRVLIERPCFPSDRYVVQTQLAWHRIDPEEGIVEVGDGEYGPIGIEGIEAVLRDRGDEIAVVLLGGVNFLTGELLDMARITAAAHASGCLVGFDLAHAAGNVPLALSDWGVDFAAWCTYKYLNGGPGAVAGLFVNEKHAVDPDRFRLGGWWGNDPAARFRWRGQEGFVPRRDAAGWQMSCPPVLALAPIGPALELCVEAGIPGIRDKSIRLTGYLEQLLEHLAGPLLRLITPRSPERRGAQLSLVTQDARGLQRSLAAAGLGVDVREPDVVRLAPAPLFNTFHEAWRAAHLLAGALRAQDAHDA